MWGIIVLIIGIYGTICAGALWCYRSIFKYGRLPGDPVCQGNDDWKAKQQAKELFRDLQI